MRTILDLPQTANNGSFKRDAIPVTAEVMRSAAQDMARNGLTDYDIADALRLDVAAVRRLIGRCGNCE